MLIKTYQVIIMTMGGQTLLYTIKAVDREHAIMQANELTPDTVHVYGIKTVLLDY